MRSLMFPINLLSLPVFVIPDYMTHVSLITLRIMSALGSGLTGSALCAQDNDTMLGPSSHMSHLVYADPMITACSSHHCVTLCSGHWLHTSGALLASAGSRLRPASSGSGDTRARRPGLLGKYHQMMTKTLRPTKLGHFTIHNKLTLPSAKSK